MRRNAVFLIALLTALALLQPRTSRGGPPEDSSAKTPAPSTAASPAVNATAAPKAANKAPAPGTKSTGTPKAAPPELHLPVFEPGMWEFRRTLTVTTRGVPQTSTVKKCTDPNKDIRQKLESLNQQGCVFSPTTHTGASYHLKWACPTQGGSITMSDVLTAKDANGYEDVLESHYGERTTRSVIVATRIGACPQPPSHALHPAPAVK